MRKLKFLIAALLPVLIAATLPSCAFKEALYDEMEEAEANLMIAVLRFNDIIADKVDTGKGLFSVVVDEHRLPEAVRILHDHGLPTEKNENLGELFQSSGLVPTQIEEQTRYVYGVSEELISSLNLLNGVIHSRVHIALANIFDDNNVNDSSAINTASVYLYYDPNRADPIDLIPMIRSLVSNSVPFLNVEDVIVLTQPIDHLGIDSEPTDNMVHIGALSLRAKDIPYLATVFGALLLLVLYLSVSLVIKVARH